MQMFEMFKPMEDRVDDLIIQNVLGENYEDIKPWNIDSQKSARRPEEVNYA